MKAIILLFVAVLGFNASAVIVRTCPQTLNVVFADPQVPAELQANADKYFSENNSVGGEFNLVDIYSSECTYRRASEDNAIYQVVLRGSLREGARHPATLVAYMNLGLDGLQDLIVYMSIDDIKPAGVKVSGEAALYAEKEYCHYGCVPFHSQIGEFSEYIVE